MPRVALAAFLLAGILASVAAAVGAQSKGEWGAKAPALLKRTEVAVAAVRGKVYVVGGLQQGLSFITPAVEEYDPATDTWRHRASLPSGLHHAGIGAVNDRIYIIGGVGASLFLILVPGAPGYEYEPAFDRGAACQRKGEDTSLIQAPAHLPFPLFVLKKKKMLCLA